MQYGIKLKFNATMGLNNVFLFLLNLINKDSHVQLLRACEFFFALCKRNEDSTSFPLQVDILLEGLFSIGVGNYFIDFINSLWKHFY